MSEKTPEPASTRRHPREPLETRVDAVIEPGDSVTDLRTGNISEGGVFVAMPEPPPEGSTVTLGMKPVPELPILRLRGQVAWIARADNGGKAGMGVRFLNLDETGRRLLRRAIELAMRRRVIPGPLGEAWAESVFPLADVEQPADVPYGVVPGSAEPFDAPAQHSWFSEEPETVAAADGDEQPEPPTLEPPPQRSLTTVVALAVFAGAVGLAALLLPGRTWLRGTGEQAAVPLAPRADVRRDVASEPVVAVTEPVVPSPLATTEADAGPRGTATKVEEIAWQAAGSQVVVTVTTDGTLEPGQVEHQLLRDPARFVLRLHGITHADTDRELSVGSDILPRLRVGVHGEPEPSELHIVFDLGSDAVVVRDVLVDGGTVVVQLTSPPT